MENNIKVLKFSATWCTPCKLLAATLKDVEGITSLDIDENPELTNKYNVRSVPTLVFLKDDVEVDRSTGCIPLATYQDIINQLNNK